MGCRPGDCTWPLNLPQGFAHLELSSGFTTFTVCDTMEVASFCAVIDTLVDHDGVGVGMYELTYSLFTPEDK